MSAFKRIGYKKVRGTSYKGEINVPYNILVETFGEPDSGDGWKTEAEWDIQFSDGTVATIYNWKNGKAYLGENGLDVEDIKTWHVGGRSRKVLDKVKEALEQKINQFE